MLVRTRPLLNSLSIQHIGSGSYCCLWSHREIGTSVARSTPMERAHMCLPGLSQPWATWVAMPRTMIWGPFVTVWLASIFHDRGISMSSRLPGAVSCRCLISSSLESAQCTKSSTTGIAGARKRSSTKAPRTPELVFFCKKKQLRVMPPSSSDWNERDSTSARSSNKSPHLTCTASGSDSPSLGSKVKVPPRRERHTTHITRCLLKMFSHFPATFSVRAEGSS
mmetsp:Transcript_47352/g.144022  ORF Transcript_47352/g.144022 Transcript_47352/m.144022 type:complete len:223 (-) Transcript_47352:398-1066(-)